MGSSFRPPHRGLGSDEMASLALRSAFIAPQLDLSGDKWTPTGHDSDFSNDDGAFLGQHLGLESDERTLSSHEPLFIADERELITDHLQLISDHLQLISDHLQLISDHLQLITDHL